MAAGRRREGGARREEKVWGLAGPKREGRKEMGKEIRVK
jgi:hypothetical protein